MARGVRVSEDCKENVPRARQSAGWQAVCGSRQKEKCEFLLLVIRRKGGGARDNWEPKRPGEAAAPLSAAPKPYLAGGPTPAPT